MNAPESVMDRLRKIKSLADSGATPGEQAAARARLEAQLQKHGLTIEDLESEEVSQRHFTVKGDRENGIFMHCIFKALHWPDDIPMFKPRWGKGAKTVVIVDLTARQYEDVLTLYEFYREAYKAEEKRLYDAFIQLQGLARPCKDDTPAPEMDPEELARLVSMMRAMNTLANPLSTGRIAYKEAN